MFFPWERAGTAARGAGVASRCPTRRAAGGWRNLTGSLDTDHVAGRRQTTGVGVKTVSADTGAPRTDLTDLVCQRKEELGISFRTLAEACVDPEDPESGPLWKRTTLDALSKGQRIKAPDFPELRALAAGLQVPLSRVQEAAGAQFLGIDTVWSADGQVRALVEGFREMSPEDQAKVLALMNSRRRIPRVG